MLYGPYNVAPVLIVLSLQPIGGGMLVVRVTDAVVVVGFVPEVSINSYIYLLYLVLIKTPIHSLCARPAVFFGAPQMPLRTTQMQIVISVSLSNISSIGFARTATPQVCDGDAERPTGVGGAVRPRAASRAARRDCAGNNGFREER